MDMENIIVRPIDCLMKRISENKKLSDIMDKINYSLLKEYNLYNTISIQIDELTPNEKRLIKDVMKRIGWKLSFCIRDEKNIMDISEI